MTSRTAIPRSPSSHPRSASDLRNGVHNLVLETRTTANEAQENTNSA
jgi:hypothetical protein